MHARRLRPYWVMAWTATAVLALAGSARASRVHTSTGASTADTIITLAPIEVSALRPVGDDPELRSRPGFACAYDVSRSYGRLSSVSDVLAGAAGVHVRQFGGIGAYSAVSVRGSSASQVAVYLDGIPLNSAQYGVVSLADLPIEALERVAVYRGGAPLGFESPGGGVIDLVTRRAEGTWGRVSLGRGSFGTTKGDIAAGWRGGPSGALVIAQYLTSDGTFHYLDDNATPHNLADDTLKIRQNNASSSLDVTARAESRVGPLAVALSHDHLLKEQGTPGTGANPALSARLKSERGLSHLRLAWAGDRPREPIATAPLAISLYALQQRDRFNDPRGELTGVRQDNDDRTSRLGFTMTGLVGLPMNQQLALLTEGRRERYTPALMLPAPRTLPASSRDYAAWGAEDQWLAASGRVALVGTLRRQATFDDFAGGPPYPGALPVPEASRTTYLTSWTTGTRCNLGWGLSIKGTLSHLARMPTLEELFGDRGGIYGNPRLKPELVRTHDAGVVLLRRWSARSPVLPIWLESQVSAYRSDARDLIVFIQNSQRSSVAQNISAARLDGLEAMLRTAWANGLLGDVTWTRQWTRDEGSVAYWRSKELPGRPRDEITAQGSLAHRRWRTFYEFHFIAANYLDRYNQSGVPARRLHNVGIALSPWGNAVEWTAECRNLTDQHVEDFSGYPLPGRLFYVGARLRISQEDHTHD